MFKENFHVGLPTYFDEVLLVHEGEVEGAVAWGEAEDAGLLIALEPLAGPLQQQWRPFNMMEYFMRNIHCCKSLPTK